MHHGAGTLSLWYTVAFFFIVATKQSQADGTTNFYLCLSSKLLMRRKTLCIGQGNLWVSLCIAVSQKLARAQWRWSSPILLVAVKADTSPVESNLETCIKMLISFNSITPIFSENGLRSGESIMYEEVVLFMTVKILKQSECPAKASWLIMMYSFRNLMWP